MLHAQPVTNKTHFPRPTASAVKLSRNSNVREDIELINFLTSTMLEKRHIPTPVKLVDSGMVKTLSILTVMNTLRKLLGITFPRRVDLMVTWPELSSKQTKIESSNANTPKLDTRHLRRFSLLMKGNSSQKFTNYHLLKKSVVDLPVLNNQNSVYQWTRLSIMTLPLHAVPLNSFQYLMR